MIPTIDDRLASIIRALTEVVLPHLPPEASLAQEQVHLSIGHLQILRAQFDAAPAFERGELNDIAGMAAALAGLTGGGATQAALADLAATAKAADGTDVRGQHKALSKAIETLVRAVAKDGDGAGRAGLGKIILEHEAIRTQKDREWFAPFGFDTL